MIQKRRLLINALVSAIQVIVIGVSFFVLYAFLLDVLGEEDFGVWALVLATTSASAIANLGLAASAVKFVAQHLARDDRVHVARIVQTAAVSVAVFLGVLLLVLYPALAWLLGLLVNPADKLPEALSILPYALVAFWLTSVGGVFLSCIDGFQRIDLRGILLIVITLVYLGLAFMLVPRAGLIGLAQAQVVQSGLLMVISWLLLRRLMPTLPLVPWHWHKAAFREMLGYSLQFQVISFSQILFEPVTKAFISVFGGVGVVAYFEFAQRMVMQIRNTLATAHQAIVPAIAEVQETNPDLVREVYVRSYRLILFFVVASLPFLIAFTPIISRLWIGAYEPAFVLFSTLLFGGWFFNLTTNPAYFANLGTGEMRWNVWGHVIAGVLNITLGATLGWLFGGIGVVAGFVLALITGNTAIQGTYHHRHAIAATDLLDPRTLRLAVFAMIGALATWLLYEGFATSWSLLTLSLAVPALYLAIVVLPLWSHPLRETILAWITTFLLRRQGVTLEDQPHLDNQPHNV